jgi:hypothetical protein
VHDTRDFMTTISVYVPGEPVAVNTYENVREFTLVAESRVSFVLEDGRSIITTLPFFIERRPAK